MLPPQTQDGVEQVSEVHVIDIEDQLEGTGVEDSLQIRIENAFGEKMNGNGERLDLNDFKNVV